MSDTPTFLVRLTTPELPDVMTLAKTLASVRQTPVQDQVVTAKRCWGIVAEHLDEKAAGVVVEALSKAGVACAAVPEAQFATLPTAEAAGTWATFSETPPLLIASAMIPTSSTSTKTVKEGPSGAQKILSTAILLGTGLPIKIGGKERTVTKTQHHADQLYVMDLIGGQPLRRWRITAEHFDYSYLNERKLYQVLGNFKLLLADLVQRWPKARQNHGTKIFLQNKPLNVMGYTSLADFEREMRWLLTL